MRSKVLCIALTFTLVGLVALAQETPRPLVDAYASLADTILALKAAEADFIRSVLDGHRHAAEVLMQRGEYERAAAEMALFANEGDNAMAGVRKRLVEGGHHHNAAGEAAGIYEPGYVIVTREAKEQVLAAASALRQATDDAARRQAWQRFAAIADDLLDTM